MKLQDLRDMIAGALGVKPDEAKIAADAAKRAAKGTIQPNRREMRLAKIGVGGGRSYLEARRARPHARIGRTSEPLTSNHWVQAEKRRTQMRSALQGIKTASLEEQCPELRSLSPSYPNVWVLSQASFKDLMAIKGVGPAKLRKVKRYLASQNVWTAWKVEEA